MSVRWRALLKLVALVLLAVLLKLALNALADSGAKLGRSRALPVVPIVLCLVPILELVVGAPFSRISAQWNKLASWQQWGIVLLVPTVLLGSFVVLTALLYSEP